MNQRISQSINQSLSESVNQPFNHEERDFKLSALFSKNSLIFEKYGGFFLRDWDLGSLEPKSCLSKILLEPEKNNHRTKRKVTENEKSLFTLQNSQETID